MPRHWPASTASRLLELEPEDRACPTCGRRMHLCDHRHRIVFTMEGALHIVSKLAHCPHADCPGRHTTHSAEEEMSIAPRWWTIGWDLFAWIGYRRFEHGLSVPRLSRELARDYGVDLSDDTIERYVKRYRAMVSARERGPGRLVEAYRGADGLVMSIDGLRPLGGRRALHVVRELGRKRIWFAEPLPPGDEAGVRGLLELAKDWADELAKPVRAWVSDMRDGFAAAAEGVFPGVPHRYCRGTDSDARERKKSGPVPAPVPRAAAAREDANVDGTLDDYSGQLYSEGPYSAPALEYYEDSGLAA